MRLFKNFERYNTSDLYIGEIFNPQAFVLDENHKKTGLTKSVSTQIFDVATRNAEGDYISLTDGSVYCDGSTQAIIEGKADNNLLFYNVESFAKATGYRRKRISKSTAIEKAKEISKERTKGVQL